MTETGFAPGLVVRRSRADLETTAAAAGSVGIGWQALAGLASEHPQASQRGPGRRTDRRERQPLRFQPHDFRRIFVIGTPPHIAQIICGHKDINTTMGYNSVYPNDAFEDHRAFIARRRAIRPAEEYRTPTAEEWDQFLGHFEKRKLSVGICARAFGTQCIHEHACIRCSLLRPEPAQRHRLIEIRDNLVARIIEAEQEGWLGEIEGLQVSLAGAEGKIAQLDAVDARQSMTIHLGIPAPENDH